MSNTDRTGGPSGAARTNRLRLRAAQRSIVVVGAGVAGLGAARALRDSHVPVVVVRYAIVFGGRLMDPAWTWVHTGLTAPKEIR